MTGGSRESGDFIRTLEGGASRLSTVGICSGEGRRPSRAPPAGGSRGALRPQQAAGQSSERGSCWNRRYLFALLSRWLLPRIFTCSSLRKFLSNLPTTKKGPDPSGWCHVGGTSSGRVLCPPPSSHHASVAPLRLRNRLLFVPSQLTPDSLTGCPPQKHPLCAPPPLHTAPLCPPPAHSPTSLGSFPPTHRLFH